MAWAKVDDSWWCHPKTMGLSLAACGLWARALSWSCQMRRRVVPVSFPAMVGADTEHVDELVEAGFWIGTDGGWEIHDWDEYQELSLSEKRAEAGRKGGKKSRPPKHDETNGEANGKQPGSNVEGSPRANGEAGTPARPDPTRPEPQTRGARKRATQLPDGWRPDDATNAKLAAQYPDVDLDRELAQFSDHAKSKGRTARDWTAAWRMWVRQADEWRRDRAGPSEPARGQPPAVGSPEWEARQREQEARAEALSGGDP